jgi:hypothetical protein
VGFLLAGATPAQAQFRDVGYTLEPAAYRVFESDNAAFQDGILYGGALGLSFGRYLELSTEYLANTGLTATFGNVQGLVGLLDRTVDARRYGTRLRLNLYNRRVIPYLAGGSGVLRLAPEDVGASSTIYALAGGGLTFSLRSRYRVSVSGEVLRYRYDPVATFLPPGEQMDNQTQSVTLPALSASVSLFLGGRSLDAQTAVDRALQEQFSNNVFRSLQFFATPFAGRIEFNDALGFPKDQNLVGVNAGVELGPFVGLRGFYWRGTTGDTLFDEIGGGIQDLQMYGGELRLRLNAEIGNGFVPYAEVGGGYLDVLSGYATDIPGEAAPPDDRLFSTVGGGLEVPLTDAVKVAGGLRSLFMNSANASDIRDPGTVYGSLMYTAGFEVRLGGRSDDDTRPPSRRPLLERSERPSSSSSLSPQQRARIDSLERALAALRRQGPAPSTTAGQPTGRTTEQTMTVPVPEQGEIYIRFGAPARGQRADTLRTPRRAIGTEELARILEAALQDRAAAEGTLSEDAIERIVNRSLDRFQRDADASQPPPDDPRIERMADEIDRLREELEARDAPEAEPDSAAAAEPPFYRQTLGRPLTYVMPIVGGRAGEGPEQVQVGVRADYRKTPSSRFHLLPEVAVGIGDGRTSLSVLANGAFRVLQNRVPRWTGLPLQPYTGAGLGIVSDSGLTLEPVLNVLLGTTYSFGEGRTLFGELSTLDVFNTNRITFGYRIQL